MGTMNVNAAPARPAVSIAGARRRARVFLDALVPPATAEAADTVVLVVSELVTNALLHGGGTCAVELTAHPDGIEVAVHDPSPQPPRMRTPDLTDGTAGFGLFPVRCAQLAAQVQKCLGVGGPGAGEHARCPERQGGLAQGGDPLGGSRAPLLPGPGHVGAACRDEVRRLEPVQLGDHLLHIHTATMTPTTPHHAAEISRVSGRAHAAGPAPPGPAPMDDTSSPRLSRGKCRRGHHGTDRTTHVLPWLDSAAPGPSEIQNLY